MTASASLDSKKWKEWLSIVAVKDRIPGIYSWHQTEISGSCQPDISTPDFNNMEASNSLIDRQIDTIMYASKVRQTPAFSVCYIA
jgi:hypothetical protein